MEFIKILLNNSTIKEAKLYNAALKAKTNPEIGITINNKAAYHVIKDCADITLKYLPLYVFGSYEHPFDELKGAFTKKQIAEFVLGSQQDLCLKQLLDLIWEKAKSRLPDKNADIEKPKIDYFDQMSDPYGEYGQEQKAAAIQEISEEQNVLSILCRVFEAD